MTIDKWLSTSTKTLETVGIGSARLDCLILLEDVLIKDRAHLLSHPEIELDKEILNKLTELLDRRSAHEPMAYIRGFTEFYGRKFMVNKSVLEPRPESETMIELLLKLDLQDTPVVVDVGTGSGALAITTKLELNKSQVIATDIDLKCLLVAKENAEKYKVNIDFKNTDLVEAIHDPIDVILANLPYVPDDYHINEAASMEPRIAIFGGPDGLDLYRKLFAQIEDTVQKPRFVLCESLPPQHEKLQKIAQSFGYKLHTEQDFIQVFKLTN